MSKADALAQFKALDAHISKEILDISEQLLGDSETYDDALNNLEFFESSNGIDALLYDALFQQMKKQAIK
ncbi:hypothetical protein [Lacticaseibacillus mingshuiensis]|uniref:hypothetical protein n=1 Tax=Lacticaseibacillus mingshuiensis TaxID=2799574 RepID=UPI00194DCB57|nr:hypothetical protein [Lacticaseibacillus mingshuiensis]